jgi:soluble lytic murein transglycosylase-like protein
VKPARHNLVRRLAYGLGSLAVLLSAANATAAMEVYYYVDASGVSHFTTTAIPGAKPFPMNPVAGRAPRALRSFPSLPASSASRSKYDELIRDTARVYGVEPALVKAVIRVESGFDPEAVSPKGAQGLMQLMPVTARSHGVSDVQDPRENIRGGVRHLRRLLDRFNNDYKLAVAAYNAGSTAVRRHGGLPPYAETRQYVDRVLRFRRQYLKEAGEGDSSRAT